MKKLLFFLIVCGGVFYGYKFYSENSSFTMTSLLSGAKKEFFAIVGTTPHNGTSTSIPTPSPPPGQHYVTCYRCQGTGKLRCMAPGCKEGMVDCPGPCLKLSVGFWEHLNVPGHDPNLLWRKFTYAGGWQAYSQDHVGQVVEMVNGVPQLTGACKICDGKGKIPCSACNGTGTIVCNVCGGRKMILAMNTAASTPAKVFAGVSAAPDKTESPDGIIKLKSGKTILGKIVIMDADHALIRTRGGKTTEVRASDIIGQP